jgi:hypothetical protein
MITGRRKKGRRKERKKDSPSSNCMLKNREGAAVYIYIRLDIDLISLFLGCW